MLIRCAWCKTITGSKPPYGGKYDKMITDGICLKCEAKYFPNFERRKHGKDLPRNGGEIR